MRRVEAWSIVGKTSNIFSQLFSGALHLRSHPFLPALQIPSVFAQRRTSTHRGAPKNPIRGPDATQGLRRLTQISSRVACLRVGTTTRLRKTMSACSRARCSCAFEHGGEGSCRRIARSFRSFSMGLSGSHGLISHQGRTQHVQPWEKTS